MPQLKPQQKSFEFNIRIKNNSDLKSFRGADFSPKKIIDTKKVFYSPLREFVFPASFRKTMILKSQFPDLRSRLIEKLWQNNILKNSDLSNSRFNLNNFITKLYYRFAYSIFLISIYVLIISVLYTRFAHI